jgi:hypothetical protein
MNALVLDAMGLPRAHRQLEQPLRELFAMDSMVANRVVASAFDAYGNHYSLWTDGRCEVMPTSDPDNRGRIRSHSSSPCARPKGLEWHIQENEPRPRAYVYVLLFGEKIQQPQG